MTQLEEKGLLNVSTLGRWFTEVVIVIAPSGFSSYRLSTLQRFMEPPRSKLPQLNAKRYIKNEVKFLEVVMFLLQRNIIYHNINNLYDIYDYFY